MGLKDLKLISRRMYFLMRWKFAFLFLSKKEVNKVTTAHIINNEDIENPLILVPHADDEWIGCSQILKKSPHVTVYYFNFLGNDSSEKNRKVRLAELKSLQEKFRFKLIVSEENQPHLDLKKLIEENNFSSIFIPCPIDWHPEHILVNTILKGILQEISFHQSLYFYNISVPLPQRMETVVCPMTKEEIEEKQRVFHQYYPSQRNVPIQRLTIQNRLSAHNSKFYALESYGKLDLKLWEELMKYIDKYFIPDFQPMAHIIDYPVKIRKYVNKTYTVFLENTEPRNTNKKGVLDN